MANYSKDMPKFELRIIETDVYVVNDASLSEVAGMVDGNWNRPSKDRTIRSYEIVEVE